MKRIQISSMIRTNLKLFGTSILIGALGGLFGAVFFHLLSFVTGIRENTAWLVLLLPLGGIATVFLYRIFGMQEYGGANKIILCLKNKKEIRPMAAPLIFVSTAITHLFGGSAGKEGAALQLGGAATAGLAKILRLQEDEKTVCVMSGMSAVFAAMFGTPFTAAIFLLEFRANRRILSLAVLPCVIASVVAKYLSVVLGVYEEAIHFSNTMPFSSEKVGKVLIVSVGIYVVGLVMCYVFQNAKNWAKRLSSNPYLRIVLGAIAIILLTICVGDMRYNGSGMHMVMEAAAGKSDWYDFLLKIVFTAITVSSGFKGGEIVPTFCIGATFGCVLGSVLGLECGLAAVLGLVGLFCSATNSPLSAVVLSIELLGFSSLPYFLIVCFVLWILPNRIGLFENRFFQSPLFRKTKHG